MANRRILVVDDEESFTRMAKLVLEDTGRFEVRVENDPTKALRAALLFKPDAIIMDILMPDMSGIEVATAMKGSPDLAGKPILFLSAAVSKNQSSLDDAVLQSCPLLTKPVGADQLIDAIDRALKP